MTKYNRTTGRVFAENANPNGNNPEIGVFGSAQLGTYQGSNDIDEISDNEAWGTGWSAGVVSNLNYPPLPEFNGILKYITQQIAYILQAGVPEWDANTVYYNNYYCSYNGKLWRSNTDDNIGNEPEQSPSWYDATTQLPIASNENLGAIRTDGVTTQVTPEGVLSVIASSNALTPIGDPIFTLSNTLNNNEIWLEGAEVTTDTYPQLYSVYGNTYTYCKNLYDCKGTFEGDLQINDNLTISPQANAQYLNTNTAPPDNTSDYELEIAFKLASSNPHPILMSLGNGAKRSIMLGFNSSNALCMWMSTNGTTWDGLSANNTNFTAQLNTWYSLKYVFTNERAINIFYAKEIDEPQLYGELPVFPPIEYGAEIGHFSNRRFYIEEGFNWYLGSQGTLTGIGDTEDWHFTGDIYLARTSFDLISKKQQITNFNLPDFRNRTIWGATDFGYLEAGLPNITGSVYGDEFPSIINYSGALYGVKNSSSNQAVGAAEDSDELHFDASRSNSIYGASSTVQPPAIKVRVKTRYQ